MLIRLLSTLRSKDGLRGQNLMVYPIFLNLALSLYKLGQKR